LYDNPLLRRPLAPADIKPRLLGHWGTTPGQNFIYVHLNRIINQHNLNMIYISGPGHGGLPWWPIPISKEPTPKSIPTSPRTKPGLKKLFKQFSFPGGIPSHVAPETPGSIHEGGELGYSLSHAFGAVFDNPDLVVACVIGDGEAETGPLATAWHSNKFLDPVTDGVVLPILHLNGYKIANPTVLARIPRAELEKLLEGCGWSPIFVEGHEPELMHQAMAARSTRRSVTSAASIARPASMAKKSRPTWPMIVLNSPIGLDRPQGRRWPAGRGEPGAPIRFRYQIRKKSRSPSPARAMEKSYRPENSSTRQGVASRTRRTRPQGTRRMGANPNANGGLLLHDLHMPDYRTTP